MSDLDFTYFQRRERHERERAELASDQTARRAHLAMADRYAERLRTMAPKAAMPTPA